MKTVRVLQLGATDFSSQMEIAECGEYHYEPDFSVLPEKDFDVVILDREITRDESEYLIRSMRAYTLFLTDTVDLEKTDETRQLFIMKRGKQISQQELRTLLKDELTDYFPGSYGEKWTIDNVLVAKSFAGEVSWRGFGGIDLNGDFGLEQRQLLLWRNNLPIDTDQALEFWLEYTKDDTVEIALEIHMLYHGYGSDIAEEKIRTFSEAEMADMVWVENRGAKVGFLSASLKASGRGHLTVTALHVRHSRRGKGQFIPGGKRWASSQREELFSYFDPGDLTPPLCVYFSGFREQEGFEGYYMMRSMGRPFLLLSDPRLTGGAFYMGTAEYEAMVEQVIRMYMRELGFQNTQVILSGISMGTFGALYYGCRIRPHTVLLSKPLVNPGNVAANERLNRPGGFPTSLDVLLKFCGSLRPEMIERLNRRFWNLFDGTDWSGTQIAVTYMIEDDYDDLSYPQMQSHLKGTNVTLYGKGLHGRHLDASPDTTQWFRSQYDRILQEAFTKSEKTRDLV